MFDSYSSTDNVGPPIPVAGCNALQTQLEDRNLLALPYVHHHLSYARNAPRYDDVPKYPGRFHGWYTHVDKSLSPSLSPVLVPTAPASPVLLPTTPVSSPVLIHSVEEPETRKAPGAHKYEFNHKVYSTICQVNHQSNRLIELRFKIEAQHCWCQEGYVGKRRHTACSTHHECEQQEWWSSVVEWQAEGEKKARMLNHFL